MALSSIWDLWNKWNIRGFVILSLSLQIFLILFAPLRKKTANHLLDFLLWLSYLMADWVAGFGIGLISHNPGNLSTRAAEVDGALQVFWVSFLLLHLGGPDTITAYSLEDSSLWRRHLLNLIFQVCAAIYVFVQKLPSDKSLMIPTILVFLAGVIKCAERILSLIFSSLPSLKERMYPWGWVNDDEFEELVKELENIGNGYSDEKEANLAESIVVKHAYFFFHIFKVFLGDLIFTNEQRDVSRKYFREVSAVDALRVISIELQFMYEMLYTKALAMRSKWSYIFRFITFTNIVIALVLFKHLKKHWPSKLDVEITYSLLFGGIVLDVIALFMLVSSDWTVARIMWCNPTSSKLNSIFHKLVSATDHLRKHRFAPCKAEPDTNIAYEVLDTSWIFRRWSESISACNLLSMKLAESPRQIYKRDRCWGIIAFSEICKFPFKIFNFIHSSIEEIAIRYALNKRIPSIANTKFVSKNPFIKELWIFIFKEVKRKSENLDVLTEVRKLFEARGDLFLKNRAWEINCNFFSEYITELNYDDSIVLWHIATEILYNKEKQSMRNDEREFSKILSDYMLYLFLNQSNVVSAVAGVAQMTSGEMLRELHKSNRRNILHELPRFDRRDSIDLEMLCVELSDQSHSSGFRLKLGSRLAQDMASLGQIKWEVISGVWVEMLTYAAGHIKGEAHMKVLSRGGELLAFVWLLMAHFGCLYKPEWGIYCGDRDKIFCDFLHGRETINDRLHW